MKVIKSEWHQVERRYAIVIDIDDVSNVFPENTKKQNKEVLKNLSSGEMSWEEFEDAASEQGIWFDWDWLDEDDWWTDRKGGYEITYEVQND